MSWKSIGVTEEQKSMLQKLQVDLSARAGVPFSLGQTLSRALECLEDSHAGKAWLNGVEAGELLEERHRKAVVYTLGQLVPALRPGAELAGLSFDAAIPGPVYIHLVGGEVIRLDVPTLAMEP